MKIQKLLSLMISLIFFLSYPSYSEENHAHEHGAHEHEKIQVGNQDEYEDDRHIPENREEKREEHSDHKEEEHEDEGHEEEGEVSSNVGPGNAVTEADHEKGFKLSDKARLSLGIETKELKPNSSFILSKETIVYSKDETGVYRYRNGWFKLIEGAVTKKDSNDVVFRPENQKEFQSGDHVAIKGVPLLRVTELDAFTAEAAGHAH